MTLNLKKHTLGVRIPNHAITQAPCRRFRRPHPVVDPHPPGQTEPGEAGWED